MLNIVLRRVSQPKRRQLDREPEKRPTAMEAAELAPLQPLLPPTAGNDDLIGAVFDEVQRELRRAGYLGS